MKRTIQKYRMSFTRKLQRLSFLKDIITYVLVFVFGWFHTFIITRVVGTYYPASNGQYMAFSEDVVSNVCWILIIPLIIVFSLRNYRSLVRLRDELANKIGLHTKQVSFIKLCIRELLITFPGAIVLSCFFMSNIDQDYWWEPQYSGWLVAFYFLFICGVATAIAMACASYALFLSRDIKHYLENHHNLNIEIYHTDGCGGLRWMTVPFLNLTLLSIPLYFIGLGSFLNLTLVREESWTNHAALWNLAWPTIFGPVMAFLVVHSTGIRKYLLSEKSILLSMLSKRTSVAVVKLIEGGDLGGRSTNKYCADINEMISLHKELEKAFPVWPVTKKAITFVAGSGPVISLLSTLILLISKLLPLLPK